MCYGFWEFLDHLLCVFKWDAAVSVILASLTKTEMTRIGLNVFRSVRVFDIT